MNTNTAAHRNGVSIITCTNRPLFFETLVNNYKRQLYHNKELIVVLNKDSMNLAEYRKKVRSFANIKIFKAPEKYSLGRCLNYAVSKTKYPFIAKFDDDDYYSPYYLKEQMRALRRSGADIVGKKAHLKYFEGKTLLVITTPRYHHQFVKFVAGGSLLFKRNVSQRVRFADITLGEDVNFMRRCRAQGFRIYASSPYNFVGIRRKNKKSHTWTASDEQILKRSRFVARTTQYRHIAIRPIP